MDGCLGPCSHYFLYSLPVNLPLLKKQASFKFQVLAGSDPPGQFFRLEGCTFQKIYDIPHSSKHLKDE